MGQPAGEEHRATAVAEPVRGRPGIEPVRSPWSGEVAGPGAVPVPGRRRGRALLDLVRALRVRQWTKNLLVFVAPAAAGVLSRSDELIRTAGAFGIFCAAASAVYLVNDVMDAVADRQHPEKRNRPVASGALPASLALVVAGLLLGAGLTVAALEGWWDLALVVAVYVAISFGYSFGLKRAPILELVTVASGFVLRAIAGGVAAHVPLSNWMLAVVSFGALFVVTGKRASERALMGSNGSAHRAVLSAYTDSFLRSTLTLTASVTVTAYVLWAFERGGLATHAGAQHIWIELTVVPVLVGILYNLQLIDAGHGGAPEELMLRDNFLQVLGLVWIVLFSVGLYA